MTGPGEEAAPAKIDSVQAAGAALAAQGYLADRPLALAVHLAVVLESPLLLEGEAGVGKTEVARALSAALGARLIRLQCHEGIDVHHAVYDWDYARQLLALRAAEGGVDEGELFARRFLLRRPLLEALESDPAIPVVLLIDEIDRADDEFEAFLLEFLSDFAVTIPELGTISTQRRPVVILTSNRTRELHDALKRRCLYHWIDYPNAERERAIVHSRLPGVPEHVATRVVEAVGKLREQGDLYKLPGIGETIVWAQALLALGDEADLDETLGAALKVHEDVLRVRERECLKVSEALGGIASLEPLGDSVVARLGELAGALRAQGTRVGVGELLACVRCLEAIDPGSREDARLALRTVLCSEHRDLERFELAFVAVFGDGRRSGSAQPLSELGTIERAALPSVGVPDPGGRPAERDSTPVPAAWSEVELLREKDFARYTPAEMAAARDMIARLARRYPTRVSRRTRSSRQREHTPDLRRTVHASLRTGGEPVQRRWRAPTRRPRQMVLICDVSGSMAPYARMLMQYMHACVAARRRVEAFAFGTRLTRITYELTGRDHDQALDRAAAAVTDFSGGTRIGDALAELNRVHGRRLGRGAAVVILSDGWDRGDPEQLEFEMARLRRAAHKLVWLNPLAAHPDYEPLTRGMRAAIPHTDQLLAGNSIASLEELAAILEEM